MHPGGKPETYTAQMLFGAKEIDFLERTITPKALSPGNKTLRKNYVPRLSEAQQSPTRCLKDEIVLVSEELVQQFQEINKALEESCDLALLQPLPFEPVALMTDACFAAA